MYAMRDEEDTEEQTKGPIEKQNQKRRSFWVGLGRKESLGEKKKSSSRVSLFSLGFYFLFQVMVLFFGICGVQATITLKSYSNYFFTVNETDKSNIIIYAGSTSNACQGDNANPCNSCTATPKAFYDATVWGATGGSPFCNERQIYPDLPFRVTVSSDNTTFSSSTSVGVVVGNYRATGVTKDGTIGPNNDVAISISWGEICAKATDDTNCTKSFDVGMSLGFDKDGTSSTSLTESVHFRIQYRYVANSPFQTWCADDSVIVAAYESLCNYYAFPGNTKAYISTKGNMDNSFKVEDLTDEAWADPTKVGSTMDASNMTYSQLRVYYVQGGDFNLFKTDTSYKDLSIDIQNKRLMNSKVDGLTNGLQYAFVAANVDQAGNVTRFPVQNDISAQDGCQGVADPKATCGTTQSVTPMVVQGLMDDKRCFIATAAYGSHWDAHVRSLRQFRDRFLMPYSWGRRWVEFYYRYSPPLAEYISHHERIRAGVRWMLLPFVVYANLSLDRGGFLGLIGLVSFIGLVGILGFLILLGFFRFLRWRRSSLFFSILLVLVLLNLPLLERVLAEETFGSPSSSSSGSGDSGPPLYYDEPHPPPGFGGTLRVPHPNAAKGLTTIDRAGVYHYKLPYREKCQAYHLRFFSMSTPKIVSNDGTIDFPTMYGDKRLTGVEFDYESFWAHRGGMWSWTLGAGFSMAHGSGTLHFTGASGELISIPAEESFTFMFFPLRLLVSYRFEYMESPWLVPYLSGGLLYQGLLEQQEGIKPNMIGVPAALGGGGLLISLSHLDRAAWKSIVQDYGAQALWLSIEGRMVQGGRSDVNVTNNSIAVGFALDY